MSKQLRFLITLAFILSIWQVKAQIPGIYVTVPSGNQTLSNDSIKGSGKWYKWTSSFTQVRIQTEMTQQGTPYQMSEVELFRDSSGTLIHVWGDTLNANGNMRLLAYSLSGSADLYVHYSNYNNGCSTCSLTPVLANITFHALGLACASYTQPACELIKDPQFEYSNAGCGPFTYNVGGCTNNAYLGFTNCFWTMPTATSFTNCGGMNNPNIPTPDYTYECATGTAHSGQGYAGIFIYSSTNGPMGNVVEGNYREYITETLNTPMVAGRRYQVSMWVKWNSNWSVQCQNMEVAFTNGFLSQTGLNPIVSPGGQVTGMSSGILTSAAWTRLTATITASSNWSTITIGNFRPVGSSTFFDTSPSATVPNYSSAYYFIDDVSIMPVETLQVSPNPVSICSGSTVTFTAGVVSGSSAVTATYNYAPINPDPSLSYGSMNHSIASMTPSSANSYSITASDQLGCITSTLAVVNFTTAPNVTVTPNPTTICATNTLVLSASGANTYSWSTGATTSTVNVGPLATTVYTVTGYRPYCPSSTKTATVTVINPMPVTISGPSGTVCPGGSYTLTASGASTYTWSTGATNTTIVVSPTTTATYTVYASNPSCTAPLTATFTIKVLSAPQNLTVSGTNTICIGSSTTLSASISNTNTSQYSITWQPGSLSGSPVTVNPSATTVYTVKATDNLGCNLSITKTYTVYVNTPHTVSVNPTVICPGSSATLTASGSTSYTWQPGGLTTTSIVVTPSVTTSYTVLSNIPACGVSSVVATVTVIPTPSLAISPSVQYPCVGTVVTYSASVNPAGTYTYNWGSPFNAGTPTVSVSPTNSGVITLTVTNTCNAVGTASTCVSLVSNKCCIAAETMSYVTIGNGNLLANLTSVNYDVYGTITITGNVTWTSSDFRMKQGAKIVVNPGASLTLSGCNLYSCTDIWEGITVLCNGTSSGSITVTNGNKIEDAYRAIYYNGLNTPYPGNIVITKSEFNKNYIGLSVNNTAVNNAVAQSNYLENCTLRSIASTTSPGNKLKCSSFYSPYIRPNGYIGYQAQNSYQFMTIGASGTGDVFDNLDYGYYGVNSGLRIEHSVFNNMLGNTSSPGIPGIGIGVYAEGTFTTNPGSGPSGVNQMEVFSSNFREVWRAVELKNMVTGAVNTNTIINATTSVSGCSTGCTGNAGVYVTNPYLRQQTTYNIITNTNVGFQVSYSQLYSASNFSLSVGNNTMSTAGTGTMTTGIGFFAGLNNFSSTSAVMKVAANTISNAKYGMQLSNILNGLRVSGNTINMLSPASGIANGLRVTGCQKVTIDNNIVTGTLTTNPNIIGVSIQSSPSNYVQCNNVSTVGQCFVFDGNCLSLQTGFVSNIMSNANDGLVLQNNGVIGSQGKISSILSLQRASGNQWNGTFANSKTLVMDAGSSATNSGLVIRNLTAEYPTPQSLNKVGSGGLAQFGVDNFGTSTYNAPPSMTLAPSGYALSTCQTALTNAQKVSQVNAASSQTLDPESKALLDSALFSLTQGPGSDAIFEQEAVQLNQDYVYGLIDRGYATTHPGLLSFYQTSQQTATNVYSDIDQLIIAGDYTQAQLLNQSAPENTTMDYNQKTVNTALLKHLQNPSAAFSTGEIDELFAMALKCPITNGNAVYQARGLVSVLLNNSFDFTDNCQAISAERRALKGAGKKGITESVLLYPNPNSGGMTVAYSLTQTASMQIYDVQGSLVYSMMLSPNNKSAQLSLQHLSQGIYYYTIVKEDGTIAKADKIVIIH